jgi:hypothetical protein
VTVGKWAVAWSEKYRRHYWWHTETRETTWLAPAAG